MTPSGTDLLVCNEVGTGSCDHHPPGQADRLAAPAQCFPGEVCRVYVCVHPYIQSVYISREGD